MPIREVATPDPDKVLELFKERGYVRPDVQRFARELRNPVRNSWTIHTILHGRAVSVELLEQVARKLGVGVEDIILEDITAQDDGEQPEAEPQALAS